MQYSDHYIITRVTKDDVDGAHKDATIHRVITFESIDEVIDLLKHGGTIEFRTPQAEGRIQCDADGVQITARKTLRGSTAPYQKLATLDKCNAACKLMLEPLLKYMRVEYSWCHEFHINKSDDEVKAVLGQRFVNALNRRWGFNL